MTKHFRSENLISDMIINVVGLTDGFKVDRFATEWG
jgi:hypothetical protein